MKKLLKLALCLVLAASAAGCGNNGGARHANPGYLSRRADAGNLYCDRHRPQRADHD